MELCKVWHAPRGTLELQNNAILLGVLGPAKQDHDHGWVATVWPAMAANPEDIELGDADELDEGGEGDAGEPAADIQLQEKAVPVRPELLCFRLCGYLSRRQSGNCLSLS